MTDKQEITRKEQGARFKELLKEIHLTQTQLADLVGSKQGGVSHAISGNIGIPPKWLLDLKKWDKRVNPDWRQLGFLSDQNPKNR
jgi:transcriptional regulator with XRE-family HTH domain